MWTCERCGARFEEPDSVQYCKEDYNGVSDIFSRRTWASYNVCPECGSEDIEHHYDDEEEEY